MSEKNKDHLIIAVAIITGLFIVMLPFITEIKEETTKSAFVEGCSQEASVKECGCMYDELLEEFGEEMLLDIANSYGSDIPDAVADILLTEKVLACVE